MDANDIRDEYQNRYPVLSEVAKRISSILSDILADAPRVDQVSVRVKAPERFLEKAFRVDAEGNPKYQYPLQEIQDQIGCRVVVHYLSDVTSVAARILNEFNEFEDKQVEESDPDHFSYRARHFVCQVPLDIRRALNAPLDVFEIQVSTLFQHAWAEANHDLAYKSAMSLPPEEQRYVAFTAAQAWGADKIFAQIWERRTEAGENQSGAATQ